MPTAKMRITLTGDTELIKSLESLGEKVYKRVIAKATRKAFAPVVKTAKARAPRETGLLAKSIGVKQKAYARSGRIVTIVGPRTGFAQDVTVNTPFGPKKVRRDPAKYAHLVEFGTAPHATAALASRKDATGFDIAMQSGDDHPGAAPKPFMRPAFDANEARAVAIMHSELAAGVIRESQKK